MIADGELVAALIAIPLPSGLYAGNSRFWTVFRRVNADYDETYY
jgi:hypothetical protein